MRCFLYKNVHVVSLPIGALTLLATTTTIIIIRSCRLLLQIPRSLLEAEVALLIGPAGTETDADERGPCSSLEQEDGEDDAETEAEGRLDEEVGKAAVPLGINQHHPIMYRTSGSSSKMKLPSR